MEVNLNKTEIMVFRNVGPLSVHERWIFCGNPVQTTRYTIKSGMENPSKSEVIGRCGGDEKNE